MAINDFRVQLATAYPDLQPVNTAKGRTLRGEIETDQGSITAYIKLLTIGDIAKEALCAVLARKLHLPVPQPYYVNVDRAFTGHTSSNLHGVAFGIHEELFPLRRINDINILKSALQQWSELRRCAAFDAWIANRDRLPHNLLFEGNNGFWMIDHEEALPSYLSPSSPIGAQLFEIIKENKSEHELYQERENLLRHALAFDQIDWDDIKSLVRPSDLPESEKYFGEYISTLRDRASHMRAIITAELGIRQMPIDFHGQTELESKDKASKNE